MLLLFEAEPSDRRRRLLGGAGRIRSSPQKRIDRCESPGEQLAERVLEVLLEPRAPAHDVERSWQTLGAFDALTDSPLALLDVAIVRVLGSTDPERKTVLASETFQSGGSVIQTVRDQGDLDIRVSPSHPFSSFRPRA